MLRLLDENRFRRKEDLDMQTVRDSFTKHENELRKILQDKSGDLVVQVEDIDKLTANEKVHGEIWGRKYKVMYRHAPRLVRIRLDWIRAIKNKLPEGNYVMMVTLFDRLGGKPLFWHKLRDDIGYVLLLVADAKGSVSLTRLY